MQLLEDYIHALIDLNPKIAPRPRPKISHRTKLRYDRSTLLGRVWWSG